LGQCAVQRPKHGRWRSRGCDSKHRAACRTASGRWKVTDRRVTYRQAIGACRALGASFDIPRTGDENSLLRRADGGHAAYLDYRRG
jgi:hypothetical protein